MLAVFMATRNPEPFAYFLLIVVCYPTTLA